MAKLLASEIIELDKKFMNNIEKIINPIIEKKVKEKLKELSNGGSDIKLYSIKQVAKLTQSSIAAVLQHVHNHAYDRKGKKLKAKKIGKQWRITEKQLEEYIEEQKKSNNYDTIY